MEQFLQIDDTRVFPRQRPFLPPNRTCQRTERRRNTQHTKQNHMCSFTQSKPERGWQYTVAPPSECKQRALTLSPRKQAVFCLIFTAVSYAYDRY